MKREIRVTGDGSHTLVVEQWNEGFHSHHGALQESMHVFIQNGLLAHHSDRLEILEIGFGTGLNAWLTAIHAQERNIRYTSIEAYPVKEEEWSLLNYADKWNGDDFGHLFEAIHRSAWEEFVPIQPNFSLKKVETLFEDYPFQEEVDIIYMDAFAPQLQPQLWSEEFFLKLTKTLRPGGLLVTYSSKGDVRRALQAAGLDVEKLPGPPGKREMVRAWKR